MHSFRFACRVFLVCWIGLFLLGCERGASGPGKSPFQGTDITGVPWGKQLNLVDHHGNRRSLADFHGKVVVLFFGFTHCPDVCPTTMGELAQVLGGLGKDAARVQVLFVSLDPARDTPEVLARFVPSFHPSFIGLTGTEADIAATAKEFKVFYEKKDTGSKAGYTLDHSASSFVFDPQGRLRLLYGFGSGAAPMVHDIKQLLSGR